MFALRHAQSVLLTDPLLPVLHRHHPNGQFYVGQECPIHWRFSKPTEPPEAAGVNPGWFYVPDVPPLLAGWSRRSYFLRLELLAPMIVLEFAAGDGLEERDCTPWTGKFWIYERTIQPAFYGVYDVHLGRLEWYHLVAGRLEPLGPNERGRHPVRQLGVELGVWQGRYQNLERPWLRWWDNQGCLLSTDAGC
jgi:hypothetical protein